MSPKPQDAADIDRLLLLEEGHCLRDQALAVCGAANGRRLVNYGATSMATLLQMVSHGMGLTLIPEIAVSSEAARHHMRVVPFAEPSRRIGLAWRRANPRKADFEALADAVKECAAQIMAQCRSALTAREDAPPAKATAHPRG